jgi:hypothetical protein
MYNQAAEAGLDDELIFDRTIPLNGVNDASPPAEIDQSLAAAATDRLSGRDGLNRPRPGLTYRAQSSDATNSWDWSIHMSGGLYLCVSGGTWYTWDSRGRILTKLTGGPAYPAGSVISGAMCTDTVYMCAGGAMSKYKPGTGTGTGFGTVSTLPTQYPNAAYILWGCGPRLCYVPPNSNVIVCSNILDPEVYDPTLQNVITLDPVTSDVITGLAIWQDQSLIVFRNGAACQIGSGIQTPIVDWSFNWISRHTGALSHQTIQQAGMDVYFLSETGRGVYSVSQMPASDQLGVQAPLSLPIANTIKRINWTVARTSARAMVWADTYLLAVPLDNAPANNAILVYSIALQSWQGTWETEFGLKTFSKDPTNPAQTNLLVGMANGILAEWTYPQQRQYYDLRLDLTQRRYSSSLVTRSFTFGEDFNQVGPYNAQFTFLESEDEVTITAVLDREPSAIETVATTGPPQTNLTIPALPFDLSGIGYVVQSIALQKVGLCNELQFDMEGTGNWTLAKIYCSAFSVRAQPNK